MLFKIIKNSRSCKQEHTCELALTHQFLPGMDFVPPPAKSVLPPLITGRFQFMAEKIINMEVALETANNIANASEISDDKLCLLFVGIVLYSVSEAIVCVLEELQDMRKQMKLLQEKNNSYMQQTLSMEEVVKETFSFCI